MQTADAAATGLAPFDVVRTHAVLRFTFGVTVAFIASELLQWLPTFLSPVLVAVLLVNVPIRPPLKLAVGLIVVMAAAALIALVLASVLLPAPFILFGVAAVVVFRALYAVAEGRPRVAPLLLLICVTTIPVVVMESSWVAASFAFSLVRATCLALFIVWISHLLWPRVRPRPATDIAPLPRHLRLRSALLGTFVLTPLMLIYLMFGLANALPVLVATTMIVVNLDFHRGRLQALGLVAGNVGGGIVALGLYLLLATHPSLPSLALLTALMALAFGWRISVGDPPASIALVACNATLIVLSSSMLSDLGTFSVWITRLTQFVIAGVFAVGMMTLLWPSMRSASSPRRSP